MLGLIGLLLWVSLTSTALLQGIAFAAQLESLRSAMPQVPANGAKREATVTLPEAPLAPATADRST